MYSVKNFTAEVKNVDVNRRTVSGHFAVFNEKDADEDIIRPGAFEQSIKERGPRGKNRIMHLWQHNPVKPLAKPHELREDDTGLYFVSQITDTSYGTDALKLYRDGVLKEHSIGFNTIQSHFDEDAGANILTELKLFEGSTVTWGAQEMATGELMKGMFKRNEIIERYNELSKAYYNGDYTDDTFSLIKRQMDYLQSIMTKALDVKESETTAGRSESTASDDISKLFDQYSMESELKSIFDG